VIQRHDHHDQPAQCVYRGYSRPSFAWVQSDFFLAYWLCLVL
jgi:hypothetical protein